MVTELVPARLDLSAIADRIASDLVRVRLTPNGVRLTTPVLFPSGAHVSLVIHGGPSHFIVTDDGAASYEAELMGASGIFLRAARDVSQKTGVRFNDHELFEIDAPADRLPGFIAIVADAARMAVEQSALKLAEHIETEARQSIADRLISIFGKLAVAHDAKIMGASQHTWKFDAAVNCGDRMVLFALTTPSANSVASSFVKLDDVRRLDPPPRNVAVLTKRAAFKPDQITILNRAAKLISADDPDADYRKLVA
ncbi:hypothetical protein [Xanthobacter autotrophicus]|uniref:hypothetical protein n=1 Tax=Xanthobacter autotrophicus TaxID=280 RepID=UPI00372818F8